MNETQLHIINGGLSGNRFLENGAVAWDKPKSQVWDEIFEKRIEENPTKVIRFSAFWKYAAAASVMLVLGLASVLWFYSKTVECLPGSHRMVQLPDGSSIELNAGSEAKYHPFRWFVKRDVRFEGEGFFEVQKGKPFRVISEFGTTTVLGTSFNVFSRDDVYKVACKTGKVMVASAGKPDPVILNPGQQVVLKAGTIMKETENYKGNEPFLWRENQFLFFATPIADVAREIERQYGIKIKTQEGIDGIFTGNFTRNLDVEEVLMNVCKPLGYTFVRQDNQNYTIIRNN
jgi:ferric-dicitrate binding protein FerR (iron transport regulator)